MPATPHIGCRHGKRVSVKLKSGEIITGKFIGGDRLFIWVGGSKIKKGKIKSFMIRKGKYEGN